MMTRRGIIGVVVVSILLFLIGMAVSPKKEKIVERKVVETKQVCDKDIMWRELKSIDDDIILLAGEGLLTASDSFNAVSRLDFSRVGDNSKKINDMASKMLEYKKKREEILRKIGYR